MNRAAYLEAAIPEPFRILGKRLQPYSLGHQLILERFNSNFAVGAYEPPGFSDLVFSVWVCSHRYQDALKALRSPWLWLRIKLWGLRCWFINPLEKILLFREYIDAHTQVPEFWIEEEGNPNGGGSSDFTITLKTVLMREYGKSEVEALNTCYSEAIWCYCRLLENKGLIRIFTDDDYRLIETAKAMEEKLEKQKAESN